MISEIDTRIVNRVQTAYLWLLDWTGVHVGTLGMAMSVVNVMLTRWGSPMNGWDVGYLLVMGIINAVLYSWQRAKWYTKWNRNAGQWRDASTRGWLVSFMLGFVVGDLYSGHWSSAAVDVLLIAWAYLLCVMLRDREPKEFNFGRRLAMGGAS